MQVSGRQVGCLGSASHLGIMLLRAIACFSVNLKLANHQPMQAHIDSYLHPASIPLAKEGAVQQGLENVIRIILTSLSKETTGRSRGQILSNICQTYGLVHLENNDGAQRTSYA